MDRVGRRPLRNAARLRRRPVRRLAPLDRARVARPHRLRRPLRALQAQAARPPRRLSQSDRPGVAPRHRGLRTAGLRSHAPTRPRGTPPGGPAPPRRGTRPAPPGAGFLVGGICESTAVPSGRPSAKPSRSRPFEPTVATIDLPFSPVRRNGPRGPIFFREKHEEGQLATTYEKERKLESETAPRAGRARPGGGVLAGELAHPARCVDLGAQPPGSDACLG